MKKGKFPFNRKGQGTVEFALSFVVFLAFMIILSDMVRICYTWGTLQHAINEGARLGSVNPAVIVQNEVQAMANSFGIGTVTVTSSTEPGGFIRWTATKSITLIQPSPLILAITGTYNTQYNVTATTLIRNEAVI